MRCCLMSSSAVERSKVFLIYEMIFHCKTNTRKICLLIWSFHFYIKWTTASRHRLVDARKIVLCFVVSIWRFAMTMKIYIINCNHKIKQFRFIRTHERSLLNVVTESIEKQKKGLSRSFVDVSTYYENIIKGIASWEEKIKQKHSK